MKKLLVLVVVLVLVGAAVFGEPHTAMWLHDVYTSVDTRSECVGFIEGVIDSDQGIFFDTSQKDIGIQVLLVESALTWDEPSVKSAEDFICEILAARWPAHSNTGLQPTRKKPGG